MARPLLFLTIALTVSVMAGYGKQKHAKRQADAPQDEIQVVAHLKLPDSSVTRFLATQHYRREYLYAEHAPGKNVTLIDVTNLEAPAVLAEVAYPSDGAAQLVAVNGNAALATDKASEASGPATPQTFRIMSFADPRHPAVKQEFAGVTAMNRDEKRGLIYLANADGVWVLQQRNAPDPDSEKEWEHMMLDAR